jgi:hypothetical protein
MTKEGWTIRRAGTPAIDVRSRTVFRDTLQDDLVAYIASYRQRLLAGPALRAAFLRKMEHIAG